MERALERNSLTLPANERDHSLGCDDAPTVLVIYGNYECSKSAAAYSLLTEAQARLGRHRLKIVYRHFPQNGTGKRGWLAAEAAEAAGAQKLFWEMHERLFANQDQLDNGSLVEHAVEVGVNAEQFLRALAAHEHAARVREMKESGEQSRVESVPAIFINNVRYERDEPNLEGLIKATSP